MKKSYKLLILNAEAQEGAIGENPTKKTLYIAKKETKQFRSNIGPDHLTKHLYILDREAEVKKDDWFIFRNYKLMKCTGLSNTNQILTKNKIAKHEWYGLPQSISSKIIASTDKSLSLSTIPQSYIKYFVEEWNKENKIKKIELELTYKKDNFPKEIVDILKVENNKVCPIIPSEEEKIDRYYSEQYSENQGIQSIEEAAEYHIEYEDCVIDDIMDDLTIEEYDIVRAALKETYIAGTKYQENIYIDLIESSQDAAFKVFEINEKLMNLVNTMYSHKEVVSLIETAFKDARSSNITVEEWFNQFKK